MTLYTICGARGLVSGAVRTTLVSLSAVLTVSLASAGETSQAGTLPAAVVDLRTKEGARLLGGKWRYSDARIVEVPFRSPGADLKPSGGPNRTHDIEPRAGAAEFDDSTWEVVEPTALEARRSTGRLCFGWYRMRLEIPERLGSFETAGSTVVFEIVVDDYAEVWVDGRLPVAIGQSGGALVRGWNSPNRLVLTREARPGQSIQLAVFAANGPLSSPPENYLWVRSATVEFLRGSPEAVEIVPVEVVDGKPELEAILPAKLEAERLAGGFIFTEGPVWVPSGHLLFSDPNANTIYRWTPDAGISVFRPKSGYAGVDIGRYPQPGSNGLAIDPQGRLTICEHGNRRVTRIEKNGALTVLADRFQGKPLNSPNDLIYRSDGALYFTDPPFGLPGVHGDPARELDVSGVYLLAEGRLTLLTGELDGPNGIALSPDERHLYVGNWDVTKKVVMRYPVRTDGTVGPGEVLFDMTNAPGEEAIDGVEVDAAGRLYVSGPGGVWILSPAGGHLGTLRLPELPANFAWGDADGRSLYLAARTGLYRLRLGVAGTARAVAAAPGI